MKYSEFKKLCGFEVLNKENMEEWAGISHALQSIGKDYFKYYELFLAESNNIFVKQLYEEIKNEKYKKQ